MATPKKAKQLPRKGGGTRRGLIAAGGPSASPRKGGAVTPRRSLPKAAVPRASARARQVASPKAAFNRSTPPKQSMTKQTAPTLRARNPGGSAFKPPKQAVSRSRVPRSNTALPRNAKPAPMPMLDLPKFTREVATNLSNLGRSLPTGNFGRKGIEGALDNPVTRAGGLQKYLKSRAGR